MNTYHIEVKLCTGTDWCTALKPIEITAEHKEDVYKKILDGFNALEKQVEKKPILAKSMMTKREFRICPICERLVLYDGIKFNYCQYCGQKLDWK